MFTSRIGSSKVINRLPIKRMKINLLNRMFQCRGLTTFNDIDKSIIQLQKAQEEWLSLSQSDTDNIFRAVATEANDNRINFAERAINETQLGILEDKIIKNHLAAEYVYNRNKDEKTCGITYRDDTKGIIKIAKPVGPIGCITPTTNPTSTIIYKTLLCIKSRNTALFSPHPRAKDCCTYTLNKLKQVAIQNGAPQHCFDIITNPTMELTNYLINHEGIKFLLATGGSALTSVCMKSGKPAVTGGQGNTPVIVDELADIPEVVHSVRMSKGFDNGVCCPAEQTLFVVNKIYEKLIAEFEKRGIYIIRKEQIDDVNKMRKTVFQSNGLVNHDIVGQKATKICDMAKVFVPEKYYTTSSVIGVECDANPSDHLLGEKLSPIFTIVKVPDFDNALNLASETLYKRGGLGHTASYFTDKNDIKSQERIEKFGNKIPAIRLCVNMPSTFGCIGDVYNWELPFSLTIGCGTVGGASFAGNVEPKTLIEEKLILSSQENMLFFKNPPKVYYKHNVLPAALRDVKYEGLQHGFIVTDPIMESLGLVKKVTDEYDKLGIKYTIFNAVEPNPSTDCCYNGCNAMKKCKPDHIIGVGGGSALDAAKIMRVLYEYPNVKFDDLFIRFMDIRKRVVEFPTAKNGNNGKGHKIKWTIMIPTTSGTGSEVTPAAVITNNHMKYPIFSFSMTPTMAIVDPQFAKSMPKSLIANTGFDALVHAIESYVSILATEFTQPFSMNAVQLLCQYLPTSYKEENNMKSKEMCHNASCIAGIAFSNAFLGLCHSLAHSMGSEFHTIPHGLANALLISQIIKYNGTDSPYKTTPWPAYKEYRANDDYHKIANAMLISGNGLYENTLKSENIQINKLYGADKLIPLIEILKNNLNIPLSIKECNIDEKEFMNKLDIMAFNAWDDQCTLANPRFPLLDDIKQIYINSYYGYGNIKENPKQIMKI
eukprot:126711_1